MFNVRFRGYDILLIVFIVIAFIQSLIIGDVIVALALFLCLLIYVTKLMVIMEYKKQYKKEVLKHGKRS